MLFIQYIPFAPPWQPQISALRRAGRLSGIIRKCNRFDIAKRKDLRYIYKDRLSLFVDIGDGVVV